MSATGQDTLKARRKLEAGGKSYDYYSLDALSEAGFGDISRLPFSLKVLLENLLRYEDDRSVTVSDIEKAAKLRKVLKKNKNLKSPSDPKIKLSPLTPKGGVDVGFSQPMLAPKKGTKFNPKIYNSVMDIELH